MKSFRMALPLALACGVSLPALAQTLPAPPTHAAGIAADTRQGSYFDDNGTPIFYQVSGSGVPLVLIHGYPLSGALFEHQQTGLASQFEVVTLDLPGFGKSGAPAGFGIRQTGSTAVYAHYVFDLIIISASRAPSSAAIRWAA